MATAFHLPLITTGTPPTGLTRCGPTPESAGQRRSVRVADEADGGTTSIRTPIRISLRTPMHTAPRTTGPQKLMPRPTGRHLSPAQSPI